jgi:hypothetical protein
VSEQIGTSPKKVPRRPAPIGYATEIRMRAVHQLRMACRDCGAGGDGRRYIRARPDVNMFK